MPVTALDPRTALVLIDLQKGVISLPLVHDRESVLRSASLLAEAFRAHQLPVIFVRVLNLQATRTQLPAPVQSVADDFSEFTAFIAPLPGDIVVTKRSWDAFYATDLDLQLRRRRITNIVLAGIAASRGVESTARSAHARGYNVTFAEDAMTDIDMNSFRHSVQEIFPRIGEVGTTERIAALLATLSATHDVDE